MKKPNAELADPLVQEFHQSELFFDVPRNLPGYCAAVTQMSEPAQRLLSMTVSARSQVPETLFSVWDGGLVSNKDLRRLIPDT